jgi:hypothetical protein
MSLFRTLSARYRVTPDHRIVWTSGNWDSFARENGAPELADGAVLGHSLWEFIEGPETRLVYEALLERVRASGNGVTLPFRCDSPAVRRFMELRVTCASNAELEIVAELIREEARPPVPLLDTERLRNGDPIRICSFCKSVESQPQSWVEVEEAVAELGLDERSHLPPLIHAVCPDCAVAAEARARH